MKRTYLLLASLLVSIASFAQWTKPAQPQAQPLEVGAERYLFNIDAEGFLCGANDWGTRASVSTTLGHKFIVEEGTTTATTATTKSYYLSNYVLSGWMANQWGYMFVDGLDAIYVDNTKDGKKNNQYTFDELGDNIFKIGLSLENTDYTSDLMAYLGINPQKADTRLYFCDEATLGEDAYAACQMRWIFTTEADYNTYIAARAQYDAAVTLGAAIDKAKAENEGIDLSEVEAIYNNTNSTADELTAAMTRVRDIVIAFQTSKASVETPANYTSLLTNPSYDDNTKDGWTGADNSSVSYNVSEFYSWDAGWSSSTFDYNQSLANLPEGVYRVGVTGYYRSGTNAADYQHSQSDNMSDYQHAKLYITTTAQGTTTQALPLQSSGASEEALGSSTYQNAGGTYVPNNMETANIYFQAGQYEPTSILCYVNDGKLTLGLKKTENENDNWTIWDNWTVQYLGDAGDAYQELAKEALARHTDYKKMVEEGEDVYYQHSVYDTYVKAYDALSSATNKATITSTLPTYEQACQEMETSMKAYAAFYEKVREAREWISNEMKAESEYTDILVAYCNDDEAEGYNGNGTASYILANGSLTPEQLTSEAAYLERIYYNAKANTMKDGDDCTSMIANANFSEVGTGWLGATTTNITWPAGSTDYPVMQANNCAFDLYQNLTGLQNGLYELDLQAGFRPGDSYYQEYAQTTPYAYINDYETKIPNGQISSDISISDATDASKYFAQGLYPTVVYGLVTDGTMKIGLTNKVRTFENCCYWAGGLKLIFRSRNEEALKTVISNILPTAQDKKDAECGQPEIDALNTAIENAQSASTGSELYNGLIALKAAMNAVDEGVTVYRNLNTAIGTLEEAIDNASASVDAVTISAAKAHLETMKTAYEDKSYSSEEANEAIEQANQYTVAIMMGKSIASEDNPVDYSSVIVNANFDPAKGDKSTKYIEGWSVDGALNGYKEYSCSFNKGTFDLHQDLTGLPKGKYKVTVHTYYRAGSFDEEAAAINAGRDTHLMKLYTNSSDGDFEANVMNLSEGSKDVTLPDGISTSTINGITVPNGTSASVACYNAGLFLNELVFTVGEDGKATIGLKLPETIGTNDYTVVGEWKLWYMGAPAEKTEQDVSSLIVNNNFDPAKGDKSTKYIEGWVVDGALNGYKEYSCSFNKGTFDLHQDLTGLPKGDYKVTVHTYYRAGSFDEEAAAINAGRDTHLMKLYTNTAVKDYETSVVNLSEGSTGVTLPDGISTSTINGITVPNGTSASVACYNAGLFLNELEFSVGDDGKATIGLKLPETIGTNDYTVVGQWNLYYYGDSSEEELEENNVSDLIVNRTFDPANGDKSTKRIDGWVVDGALNGYKEYSCSFNKGTFDLHQDLTGLPEGTYKATVHTYYRAGSFDEEASNINAGNDTHLMKFYAQAAEYYETSIMNLSEGSKDVTLPDGISTSTINGITVPNGTSASVACYNAGLFLNELPFYVDAEGKATIGLKLDRTIGTNDYTVVGEWNLYYYGSGNNVERITTPVETIAAAPVEATPVAFYNLNGVRLSQPQRGINIIRMSDGTARKVMVK